MWQNVLIADMGLKKVMDAITWFAKNAKITGVGFVAKEYTQKYTMLQLIYLDVRVDNFNSSQTVKILWSRF